MAKEKDTEAPAAPEPDAEALTEPETPAEPQPGTDAEPVEPEPTADAEAQAPTESAPRETPAEEQPAEAAAVATQPAADPEAQAPTQSAPKKKRKRLPRALRPVKTRRTRTPSAERKAITREAAPEHDRGRRQERRGVVVSDSMDKTIVVKVDTIRSHPRYKKVIRRSIKFHAHDEQNSAKVGDVVRIVETRPLSKTKNWRLAEIVEAAK
jgi:small subunit ribosomal protein S17